MKFALIAVVCLFGAVLAHPSSLKRKRDILPGDPRYGTDYHHQHHHHHSEQPQSNGVEVSRAIGGYASSSVEPERVSYQNNFQTQQVSYEAPRQTITYEETVHETVQPAQQYIPAPSAPVTNYRPSDSVETVSNAYLSPVQQPQVHHQQEHHQVASQSNQYLAPVVQVVRHQEQPTNTYLGPAIRQQRPIDSYGAPVVHHQAPVSRQQINQIVHHQVHTVQPAPVQTQVRSHSHNHVQQQAVRTVANIQEQVRHVQQVVQPVVHRQVAVARPAVQHQIVYQSAPQTYESFGSSDSSSFNIPAPQVQHVSAPQTYVRHVPIEVPSFVPQVSYEEVSQSHHEEPTQQIGDNGGYVY